MISLNIKGLSCAGCVASVEKALSAVAGVTAASVNFADNSAMIEAQASVTAESLMEAVVGAGYDAEILVDINNECEIELNITGMTCAGCVGSVEKALAQVEGVSSASVNFAESTARVTGIVVAEALISAVDQAGYGASVLADHSLDKVSQTSDSDNHENSETQLKFKRAWVAAIPGFGLMILGWFNVLPGISQPSGHILWPLVGFLTLWVLQYSGGDFYRGAWKSIKHKQANMDTLIALGTGAAWLYSMLVIVFPHIVPSKSPHAYFEAAMIIIALINFGNALEARARRSTSQAIQRLVNLQPPTARLVTDEIVNGEKLEKDIPVALVKPGDLLRVRPGDQVPVDGVIVEGGSSIDESMLTGEFMPQEKSVDDKVSTGTLNKTGSFIFKATRTGSDTVLAQIVKLVRKAQSSKPDIARLVDKISSVFVPAVVLIAIVSCVLWLMFGPAPSAAYAFETTMSVLIIACPCALGLATPISIILGVGKAAEAGILVKDGQSLHRCRQLTTVVFDKTGTLTEGKPKVAELLLGTDVNHDEVVGIAAGLEKGSEHVLAEAVLDYAREKNIAAVDVSHFDSVTGRGIQGVIKGVVKDQDNASDNKVYLGNLDFMRGNNVELDLGLLGKAADAGYSSMYLAIEQSGVVRLSAVILIHDPVKEDSAQAIKRIKEMGIKVVMLSGDNEATVAKIAEQTNINEFHAGLLPQEKNDWIVSAQNNGEVVAMVGDGVNDAPSLVQADVGFAIGVGTDVAIESSDITLMGGSVQGVANAVKIARATVRNIKQNLFGAFIYNSMGIPVAAGVLYLWGGPLLNPMFAGAAMALSSLTVVTNANRLRSFKLDK